MKFIRLLALFVFVITACICYVTSTKFLLFVLKESLPFPKSFFENNIYFSLLFLIFMGGFFLIVKYYVRLKKYQGSFFNCLVLVILFIPLYYIVSFLFAVSVDLSCVLRKSENPILLSMLALLTIIIMFRVLNRIKKSIKKSEIKIFILGLSVFFIITNYQLIKLLLN